MTDGGPGRTGLRGLVGDVGGEVSRLVRREISLAKQELADSAKQAGEGAALLGGAGVAGGMSVLFLSLAGWQGLSRAIGPTRSALLLAGGFGGGAVLLAQRGREALKHVEGAPATVESLKRMRPGAIAEDVRRIGAARASLVRNASAAALRRFNSGRALRP